MTVHVPTAEQSTEPAAAAHTPDWVKRAVFYQIFPDRFARGAHTQHVPGIRFKPWGADPAEQGFQGGDLYGVAEQLDYLKQLGITALYLCPIFASASNHRYHTYDYLQVDPLLGGNDALRHLLDQAHAREMKVVLDGVFNHASRGFWAFHHILEVGGDSPYIDWFTVHDWPLNPYPKTATEASNYAAWWDLAALPKFNIQNPGVRDYLLRVAKYWVDFGIDGWRLDVPDEIKDGAFWQEFRRVVKGANPNAYIVGEIWHEATDWLRGDRFDAVMNYVFSRAALGFFGARTLRAGYRPGNFELAPLDAAQLARRVEHLLSIHPWEVTQAQLNLIDSHDTARALWIVKDDESALRLCLLFQMTMPGAPCIYYGTEIGMTGGPDPDCRGAFPWDEADWNQGLLAHTRRATALRHAHPALSLGGYRLLYQQKGVFGFQRDFGGESVVVLMNSNTQDATATVAPLDAPAEGNGAAVPPAGTLYRDVWGSSGAYRLQGGKLARVRIPARDAAVLVRQ